MTLVTGSNNNSNFSNEVTQYLRVKPPKEETWHDEVPIIFPEHMTKLRWMSTTVGLIAGLILASKFKDDYGLKTGTTADFVVSRCFPFITGLAGFMINDIIISALKWSDPEGFASQFKIDKPPLSQPQINQLPFLDRLTFAWYKPVPTSDSFKSPLMKIYNIGWLLLLTVTIKDEFARENIYFVRENAYITNGTSKKIRAQMIAVILGALAIRSGGVRNLGYRSLNVSREVYNTVAATAVGTAVGRCFNASREVCRTIAASPVGTAVGRCFNTSRSLYRSLFGRCSRVAA